MGAFLGTNLTRPKQTGIMEIHFVILGENLTHNMGAFLGKKLAYNMGGGPF